MKYCNSPFNRSRFKTREVAIGSVLLGGDNPVRVQSMTTTDTMDTEGSIAQSARMIDAGCEIVRLTAPSKKDAENLKLIKEGLVSMGYNTPLVADIHFTPNAAEVAADYVEKVRVNPGNYADKKKFEEYILLDNQLSSYYPKYVDGEAVLKPSRGVSSNGVVFLDNYEKDIPDDFVIQKRIRGTEYTIDCFFDLHSFFLLKS